MLVSRPAARNPAAAAAIATTTRTERTRGIFIVSLHRVGATSSPGPVTHAAVAVDALRRLALAVAAAQDVVDEVLVAALAVALEDARVARRDLDRLVEVLEREALRVAIAVVRLRQVLGDRVVGEMAVDAAGRAVVRPLGRRGVLVVHDVAVRAGARVGREVAEALADGESERAASRRGPPTRRRGGRPLPPARRADPSRPCTPGTSPRAPLASGSSEHERDVELDDTEVAAGHGGVQRPSVAEAGSQPAIARLEVQP